LAGVELEAVLTEADALGHGISIFPAPCGWVALCANQQLDFARHRLRERFVKDAHLLQVPREGRNLISSFKQVQARRVSLLLVCSESVLGSRVDRIREKLSISERVRNAVSGQRVLEISRVANQCPAGSMRLPKESEVSGEAVKVRLARNAQLIRKTGSDLRQQLPEGAVPRVCKQAGDFGSGHRNGHARLAAALRPGTKYHP
jgi:hypothetical protein